MTVIEEHARSLFLAALERAPDQWHAFLDEAGGDDAELRARVEQLLHAHQAIGSIHGGGAEGPAASINDSLLERPGTVIGPYKLLEQIGEGGFGIVFMAEQQQPVRRKVALKVLKPGMDTKQVVARFEAERQALALMDHPHIAHVHDAGTTESGRPYFVMELIRGMPITAFCDDNRLTPRARLDLFLAVCQAVQHAHQKGIIHRDLKPSNVLVTLLDGTPVPKVIDFGIAKALGHERLTDKTLCTGFAQMIGTPLYMSPEQAAMSGQDADTRTDIYSLGVLLYELLTGTTPFDKERLKEASYDEIRRIIGEEEPARPSTRISTLGQAATTVSANRKSEPRRLSQLFRGELDWIVMKALEKDRNRRYETASSLAADVQRYLDDEPVQACPPTLVQRAAKWSRRHRSVVWAAVLLLVVALMGSGVATLLIAHERDAANANYRMAQENLATANTNYQLAQANLDRAYRILDKVYMATVEKRLPREKELTAEDRQFLENALPFYEEFAKQNSDDPRGRLTMAEAYCRVGGIHEQLGQEEQAVAAYRQALAVSSKLATQFPNDPDYRQNLARSYASLGGVFRNYLFDGRRAELEQAYAEALRLQKRLVYEDPARLDYQQGLGWTYFLLGMMHILDGPLAEAEEPVRRAVKIREQLVAARPTEFKYRQELGMSLGNLGNVFTRTGRYDQAEAVVRRELEVRQQIVDDFPAKAEARYFLADAYMDLAELLNLTDQFQKAVEVLRQEVSLRNKLATEFPSLFQYQGDLAGCITRLADALRGMGAQDEAAAAYQEALAVFTKAIHLQPENARVYVHRGALLARLGAGEEAVADWEHALQHGAAKPEVINSMGWSLAVCLPLQMQNPEGAVQLAQQAVALAPQKAGVWIAVGATCYRAGQWNQAVTALEKSIQLGSGGNSVPWFFLAKSQWQLGELKKARQSYDRGVQWMDQHKPYDEDHCRLRAEAAALLGIPEQPATK